MSPPSLLKPAAFAPVDCWPNQPFPNLAGGPFKRKLFELGAQHHSDEQPDQVPLALCPINEYVSTQAGRFVGARFKVASPKLNQHLEVAVSSTHVWVRALGSN